MKVRWFGEPWPSKELRAPVCEDDAYRVAVPLGYRCVHCDLAFAENDQGVVMGYGGSPDEGVTFPLAVDGQDVLVVAAHLECFLYSMLGPNWRTFLQRRHVGHG